MEDNSCINRDYIGVIKETRNGFLEYQMVPVEQDEVFIKELEAIQKNNNRTLMDLQTKFTSRYPERVHSGESFDYIYPSEYYNSYINTARYPKIISYRDYKKGIEDEEKRLKKFLLDDVIAKSDMRWLKQNRPSDYNNKVSSIEADIRRKMNDYKINLKKRFDCIPFIYAYNYTKKLQEVKKLSSTKMFSTDQLGWSNFTYPIDKDLTIFIKTNFGYGSAAYFFCNLQYKGIDILPYTCVVKYYYVMWTDLIRHTRQYRACRDSWEEAFDFVVETVNLAKQNQDKFIKEWIVNEIEEMMDGLKAIVQSPQKHLENYLGINQSQKVEVKISSGFYQLVRNHTNNDVEEYNALPQEKTVAFKAEKITGCLLLLDNLRKLQSITTIADKCIKEIEELNLQIYPEIKEHIVSITIEVQNLNKKLDKVMQELTPIQKTLGVRTVSISALYNKNKNTTINGKPYTLTDAQEAFDKAHPEYQPYLRRYETLNEKAQTLREDIRLRTNFLNILKDCADRIEKQLNVA